MILRVILAFTLLIISAYLGIWLHQDPGYVLIMFRHWTIESTVWMTASLILILILFIQTLFGLLKKIVHIPYYCRQWISDLRLKRAQAKTKRGLIEFSEGQWQTAKKHLIAAAPNTPHPLVNYLTAAKAAEKLGDHQLRDHYLHLAQTAVPDATIAIELTQAQLQIDNQEWKAADETLQALQVIAPDHPYVSQLCLKLYENTQNWAALLAVLPKLKSSKTLTELNIQNIKKQAYLAILDANIHQSYLNFDLHQAMQSLPKDLKNDSDIVSKYARYLLNQQQDQQAEKIIRESLKTSPTNELLALYAHINTEYVHIPFIESLIEKKPDSAALHACVGQLFLAKQVWGSAKTHLEKSIQIHPSSQAYYALGTLLEKLNQPEEACKIYKQGLNVAMLPR